MNVDEYQDSLWVTTNEKANAVSFYELIDEMDDEPEAAGQIYGWDSEFQSYDEVEFMGLQGTVMGTQVSFKWQVPVEFDYDQGRVHFINADSLRHREV